MGRVVAAEVFGSLNGEEKGQRMGNDSPKRLAEPKRHHQVPKFYLCRFATSSKKISVYDRMKRQTYGTSVENVTVENGFYDFPLEDGAISKDAEKALQRVEIVGKTALDAIDHAPANWAGPSEADRIGLAIFIAVQAVRTREYRHAQEEMEDLWIRMQMDLNLSGDDERRARYIEHLTGKPPTKRDLDLARLVSESIESFRVGLDRRRAVYEMFHESQVIAPLIASRPWSLLVTGKRSFVTSDRPVTLWRQRTHDNRQYGVGIGNAEAIYFPLDPYKLLVLGTGFDGGWRVDTPTSKEIRRINQEVAHWSQRWVLHHPDHVQPLRGLTIPTEGPVLHINGIAVRPGVNVWNQLRRGFIERTEVPVIHFGFGVDRSRSFAKRR